MRDAARFQNAQGINHFLRELYTLLARDRISPRRAAVLAYMLLRSVPAIDNDPYPQAGRAPVREVDRFAVTKSDDADEIPEIAGDPPQPDPEGAVKSSKPN